MHSHGHAGIGAVNQVIQSRTAALPPTPYSRPLNTREIITPARPYLAVAAKIAATPIVATVVFAICSILAVIFDSPTAALIIFIIATIASLRYIYPRIDDHFSARYTPFTPVNPFASYNPVPDVARVVHDDFRKVLNGEQVSAYFHGEEIPWIIGALGEVRTARILSDLDYPGEAIHDIEITDNARTVANIDHLICSDRGIIVIDTKIWSQLPHVVNGEVLRDSPNADTISTIAYESSFLPEMPAAIVVAVGGKSKHQIPVTGIAISHYPERFNDSTVRAACPIILMSQDMLGRGLTDLYRHLNKPGVSPSQILNSLRNF